MWASALRGRKVTATWNPTLTSNIMPATSNCPVCLNDEWLLQHRYMQIEGMAELTPPLINADPAKLPPMAA